MFEKVELVGLHLLFIFFMTIVWGCAPQSVSSTVDKVVAAPMSICNQEMAGQVAALGDAEVDDFLARADAEGGEVCWSKAVSAALEQQKTVPRTHLVKALDAFNRNATTADFHRSVGQYLSGLAEQQASYSLDDRRLLEAYSRYVIRTARSQDDPHLKTAQLACARLDRALYARLFE